MSCVFQNLVEIVPSECQVEQMKEGDFLERIYG
jgi:hypothetical protein